MIQKQRTLRKTQSSRIHRLGPKKSAKNLKSPRNGNGTIENDIQFYKSISLEYMIDNEQMGECICLAYAQNNGIIKLNESALKILMNYGDYFVSFVSVYGQRASGKSFFCDKILNLAGFQGNYFFKQKNQKSNAIYIWSIPFKKENQCIFLLDVTGFQSNLLPEKSILNLMTILSSILVILPKPEDISADAHKKVFYLLKDAMNKMQIDNFSTKSDDQHWPRAVYCPLRSYEKAQKQQDILNQIFQQYKFLLIFDAASNKLLPKKYLESANIKDGSIDKRYLKGVSQLFKDVYENIAPKTFHGMQFNGRFISSMLGQLIAYMNTYQHIDISSIFSKIMMEQYQKAYLYYKMIYNEQLKEKLKDGKAKMLDNLLDIFKQCSQNIWKQFAILNIEPKFRDFYEQKLEKHINEQQQVILQTNRKKTLAQLDRLLKMPQNMNSTDDLQQFLLYLWNQKPELDHDRTRAIAKYLPKLSSRLQNFVEEKNPQRAQFYQTLKSRWSQLRDTNSRKFESIKKQISRLEKQEENLSNQIEKLHNQLSDIKNHGLATMLQKTYENQNNQIQKMTKEVQQNQLVEQDQVIEELKKQIQETKQKTEQIREELLRLNTTKKKQKIKSHSQSKLAKPVGQAMSSRKLAQVRSVSKNRQF